MSPVDRDHVVTTAAVERYAGNGRVDAGARRPDMSLQEPPGPGEQKPGIYLKGSIAFTRTG